MCEQGGDRAAAPGRVENVGRSRPLIDWHTHWHHPWDPFDWAVGVVQEGGGSPMAGFVPSSGWVVTGQQAGLANVPRERAGGTGTGGPRQRPRAASPSWHTIRIDVRRPLALQGAGQVSADSRVIVVVEKAV